MRGAETWPVVIYGFFNVLQHSVFIVQYAMAMMLLLAVIRRHASTHTRAISQVRIISNRRHTHAVLAMVAATVPAVDIGQVGAGLHTYVQFNALHCIGSMSDWSYPLHLAWH